MEIALKVGQSRPLIDDDRSLVEVLRGLGPTIFEEFQVVGFVNWLDERVSDYGPLTRGCT